VSLEKFSTLPILLREPKILLIGYGNVGKQKAKVLRDNDIEFKIIKSNFTIDLIEDYKIIIDATSNKDVLKALLEYKKESNILLNVVDRPEFCDFYFSSILNYKKLKIAISSDGASPTLVKIIKDKIKRLIPSKIEDLLEKIAQQRAQKIIDIDMITKETNRVVSNVFLVGCGLGDVELLSIKAYKTIKSTQVILYDHLITQEILDLIPHDSIRVYVGKQKSKHSHTQEQINNIILEYTTKGYSVARLKSGDPFIFGRGFEEYQFLLKHNINVEVIPGISSAISATTIANIPLTSRGYLSSFSVVTAHLKDNKTNLEWISLLNRPNHAVVALMALSKAEQIEKYALKLGIDSNLKVTIISNASTKEQKSLTCKLSTLAVNAKSMQRPAILLFGDNGI